MAKTCSLPHYRLMTSPQSAPSGRSRPWWTAAAFFSAGIATVQLGTRAILWFLPYHVAGFVNELVLFAIAGLIGLALFLIRRRQISPPPIRSAVVAASLLYLITSSFALGWSRQSGLGLGGHDYALFSTPGCDFTARFERPPQHGRVKGIVSAGDSAGEQPLLYVAVLADVGTATAFRAECLPVPPGSDMRQTAQNLVTGLSRWAEEISLNRRTSGLRNDQRGPIFAIDGEIRGSILPEQESKASRTLVGLRSYVGPNSVMTVYVFQPRGDALSPEAISFLDGVQRR